MQWGASEYTRINLSNSFTKVKEIIMMAMGWI